MNNYFLFSSQKTFIKATEPKELWTKYWVFSAICVKIITHTYTVLFLTVYKYLKKLTKNTFFSLQILTSTSTPEIMALWGTSEVIAFSSPMKLFKQNILSNPKKVTRYLITFALSWFLPRKQPVSCSAVMRTTISPN